MPGFCPAIGRRSGMRRSPWFSMIWMTASDPRRDRRRGAAIECHGHRVGQIEGHCQSGYVRPAAREFAIRTASAERFRIACIGASRGHLEGPGRARARSGRRRPIRATGRHFTRGRVRRVRRVQSSAIDHMADRAGSAIGSRVRVAARCAWDRATGRNRWEVRCGVTHSVAAPSSLAGGTATRQAQASAPANGPARCRPHGTRVRGRDVIP